MVKTSSLHVQVCCPIDCLKGRVVCGTVYEDMHFKDLLGFIARVEYRIPVPGFCLVLHYIDINTLMGQSLLPDTARIC